MNEQTNETGNPCKCAHLPQTCLLPRATSPFQVQLGQLVNQSHWATATGRGRSVVLGVQTAQGSAWELRALPTPHPLDSLAPELRTSTGSQGTGEGPRVPGRLRLFPPILQAKRLHLCPIQVDDAGPTDHQLAPTGKNQQNVGSQVHGTQMSSTVKGGTPGALVGPVTSARNFSASRQPSGLGSASSKLQAWKLRLRERQALQTEEQIPAGSAQGPGPPPSTLPGPAGHQLCGPCLDPWPTSVSPHWA